MKNYVHTPILQALAEFSTGSVPVTEPGTGSGTGDRAWYRIALVIPVPVPVPVRNSVPVGSKFQSYQLQPGSLL